MRTLTQSDFLKEAKPQLLKLVKAINPDASDQPFVEKGFPRLIIFLDSFFPEGDFLLGLREISNSMLEEGFFLSVTVDNQYNEKFGPIHWYLLFSELDGFQETFPPNEYTMYSKNGTWAIVQSLDFHGLFTCPKPFLKELMRFVPDLAEHVHLFLSHYRELIQNEEVKIQNINWIPPLLDHIYGPREAKALLVKHDLVRLLLGNN